VVPITIVPPGLGQLADTAAAVVVVAACPPVVVVAAGASVSVVAAGVVVSALSLLLHAAAKRDSANSTTSNFLVNLIASFKPFAHTNRYPRGVCLGLVRFHPSRHHNCKTAERRIWESLAIFSRATYVPAMHTTFDYDNRRASFSAALDAIGIDAALLPLSADLEYLTGLERRLPTFGDIGYAHDWVAGMLVRPGTDPVFILPRMMVEFDMPSGIPGDLIVISELDDGPELFSRILRQFGPISRLGVGARIRGETLIRALDVLSKPELVNVSPLINQMRRIKSSEELDLMRSAARIADTAMAAVTRKIRPGATERDLAEEIDHQMALAGSRVPSFDTGVWSIGVGTDRDADARAPSDTVVPGTSVSFDFGAVVGGYCSDFGRTVHIGEPTDEFVSAYNLVMAAQAAGIAAVGPGTTAAAVHRACRNIITEANRGDLFRHRTGHCIGLDVHERPYISEEDETELEPGMTFTIEPSLYGTGGIGVRVEDIIVCGPERGRKLNDYATDLVVID
jgi:Xaa-Pro aminopeptidase